MEMTYDLREVAVKTLSPYETKDLWLQSVKLTELVIDALTQILKIYRYTLGDRILNKCLDLTSQCSRMVEFGYSDELWKECHILRRDIMSLLHLCSSKLAIPLSRFTAIAKHSLEIDKYLK